MFAGGLLLIYTVNRLMNQLRGSRLKQVFLLILFLVFTLVPAGLGWWLAVHRSVYGLWYWLFPGVVILLGIMGELRLLRKRSQIQGTPPDKISPPRKAGLAFLRSPITSRDLTQVNYTLYWPGPDITVAHLTDLHLNQTLPLEYYQHVIYRTNENTPDLVFLSGDFVTLSHEINLIPGLLEQLSTTRTVKSAGVQPGKAIFASLGNHDYWSDPDGIRVALKNSGVTLLNEHLLRAEKDGKEFLIGADDRPWGLGIELDSRQNDAVPGFILSHSPDNIFDLADIPGWWVVFSGHVHSGQFRLPLPWGSSALFLPSKYGRLLDHGHFEIPSQFQGQGHRLHHFVSAGIGASEPPVRLYCPPEILVIRLKEEPSQDQAPR